MHIVHRLKLFFRNHSFRKEIVLVLILKLVLIGVLYAAFFSSHERVKLNQMSNRLLTSERV